VHRRELDLHAPGPIPPIEDPPLPPKSDPTRPPIIDPPKLPDQPGKPIIEPIAGTPPSSAL
jgi:hypothetical protein